MRGTKWRRIFVRMCRQWQRNDYCFDEFQLWRCVNQTRWIGTSVLSVQSNSDSLRVDCGAGRGDSSAFGSEEIFVSLLSFR
jgi:hypothetical protein